MKNIRIQLFLDFKQYCDIKEAAATRKMVFSNDSDMIRKILFDYTEKIANVVITAIVVAEKTKKLNEQLGQRDAVINSLQASLKGKNNEIDILNNNLSVLKKDKKKVKK